MKKLNLGCGNDYRKGWVNLDFNRKVKADVYLNIEKGLPFKDNYFDYIYTEHVLEHIVNFIQLMVELKRVCKNSAIIDIRVPHALSIGAYQDPTHVRFFTYMTFDFFTKEGFLGVTNYDLPRFEIISKSLNYLVKEHTFLNFIVNPIINLYPRYYERLFGWIFPCGEVRYKLKVIKDE